jgi:hypothetical protein
MLTTLATALLPHMGGDTGELSGWDNFKLIVTKPDNIPIVILLVMVSFFTWMALREARKHDKLVEEGRKKDILKAMQD